MRVSIQFPPPWDVKNTQDGRVAAILPNPAGAMPDAIVTYGPLVMRPDETSVWLDQALADVPRGARPKTGALAEGTTRDGWGWISVDVDVVDGGGQLVELRVILLLTFGEHGVAVTVRAGDRERLAERRAAILEILTTARPDWRSHPTCLVEYWDLERPKTQKRAIVSKELADTAFYENEIARLSSIEVPTAGDHVQRSVALLSLARHDEALAAARDALSLAPGSASAHYAEGVALGSLGTAREAIAAWQRALAIEPSADIHCNIGQAHQWLREPEPALRAFEAALALDPDDILLRRKLAQCLHALGRIDDAEKVRAELRDAWTSSRDPRVRIVQEYVFDQFDGPGFRIHAVEPLAQRTPGLTRLVEFRAVDAHDRPLGSSVHVETSDQAKQAGTPFVIGVAARQQFKVVATLETLPPYPELRDRARDLLAQLLRPTPPS
ncbi:MAG: tetratricopeptide repeat protein [Kofleriaceae bacterium]